MPRRWVDLLAATHGPTSWDQYPDSADVSELPVRMFMHCPACSLLAKTSGAVSPQRFAAQPSCVERKPPFRYRAASSRQNATWTACTLPYSGAPCRRQSRARWHQRGRHRPDRRLGQRLRPGPHRGDRVAAVPAPVRQDRHQHDLVRPPLLAALPCPHRQAGCVAAVRSPCAAAGRRRPDTCAPDRGGRGRRRIRRVISAPTRALLCCFPGDALRGW